MRKQCFSFLFLVLNTFPISSVGTQSSDEETARLINLRLLVDCKDQVYESNNIVHSNFWVLVNYIQASHGDLRCSTNVTYTTHADYRYLNNVGPLVERWRSPISLALYAPGLDFMDTVKSILWLRQCDSQQKLIKELVSFHIYFDLNEIPKKIPKARSLLKRKINCRELPPFEKLHKRDLYRLSKGLEYPVNVGRNIAINAALTHFVLASDIELYPSPGLAQGFLQMLDNNHTILKSEIRIVYPLKIFEVQQTSAVPSTKYELQNLLAKGSAQSFHLTICPSCHSGPRLSDWINSKNASNNIKVFHVTKWKPYYKYWEPICIGTKNDPHYDERLTWEGMWDKWTQIYTLCLLDYEFHTLDNAFLVHKPGIKKDTEHHERLQKSFRTYKLLMRDIILELIEKYSWHRNCAVN